jgi:colicin import membrane protein
LAITDCDARSDRSRVTVRPRYAVPLKPKLKPMDHWDMIVAFDSAKHMEEEEYFERSGRDEVHARFRAVLDAQMEEVRELRDQEAANKQKEIDDMSAQIKENTRIKEAEEKKHGDKKALFKQANDEMTLKLEQRKQREQQRKQKEQDDVLNWVNAETARQDQERKDNAEEYARKCAENKKEMDELQAASRARRAAQKAAEKQEVVASQKAMDDAEGKGRQEVADRMARLDHLAKTFGAALAERNEKEEAAQQARIKRVQEEGERLSKADAERRKSEHERKVKDMLVVRAKQVKAKGEQDLLDIEAGKRQKVIFQQQLEEGLAKDEAKRQYLRKARADQDLYLVDQMRNQLGVHPLQFGMTDHTKRQDIAMNREIFEQMAHEGFEEELTNSFLKFKTDKGRTGKLDPLPSVAVYDADIHPLEQYAVDV